MFANWFHRVYLKCSVSKVCDFSQFLDLCKQLLNQSMWLCFSIRKTQCCWTLLFVFLKAEKTNLGHFWMCDACTCLLVCTCACVCWFGGVGLAAASDCPVTSPTQASRREFRAHLDEVMTLKPRYSTLDQVNPLLPITSMLFTRNSRQQPHPTSRHPRHLGGRQRHLILQAGSNRSKKAIFAVWQHKKHKKETTCLIFKSTSVKWAKCEPKLIILCKNISINQLI